MADFVPSQKYASDFNKAKKYENGDAVQAETVNNLIEGQLFVQGIASNQPRVEEDNTEGQPIVYFENKDGLPRFVFRNIKGKDGKGEKGDNGNIMRFTDSALYARSDVGTLLTIGSGNLINGQNVAVGDVVLDIHYQEGENYYICIWEVTTVNSEYSIYLRGMGYIFSTGGGGTVKIEVDNELSTTSKNPVQNKVVTIALNNKVSTTTTVNGHPLSSNVTVTKSDVGLSEVANESPATIRAGLTDTNVKNALGYTPTSPSDLAELNKTLSLAISTLDEDITDIKTGEVVVNKAENDSNGNKIITTYATKSEANARAKTIEYSWESIGADGVNPFKLNLVLKDANGNQLSTTQIDFPLEQMVVGAEYDKDTKDLILYTTDGQVAIPVDDIFEGLATKTELDATNKTVNNLSTEVSGYSQRITDAEADIGQLQDEKLDDIGTVWTCPTQVGTWSRVCTIEGYSNYLIQVKIDQSGEATSYVFAVGAGYDTANISQISSSGYPTPNHDMRVRLQRSSSSPIIFHFEMLNYYSASGSTVNVVCKAVKLSDSGILTPITTVTTNNVESNKEELYAHHNGVIVNSGNFEDYVRNYMNKSILDAVY